MEALTRMVADSLARHGLDRPIDPRRLQWSRWFRCDSTHSLLVVPSKPGIFALAEEVMNLAPSNGHNNHAETSGSNHVETAGSNHVETAGSNHVETAALGCPERSSASGIFPVGILGGTGGGTGILGGAALQRCDSLPPKDPALAAEVPVRRMLAIPQFSEDDDMAFVLDRMFTRINPMRDRLALGSCFLRFVVIEDQAQRRSICTALNQWMLTSAEKASGLPPDFSSSLEMASVARTCPEREPKGPSPASAGSTEKPAQEEPPTLRSNPLQSTAAAPYLNSGAAKNLHCPHPLPSGL